jgi:MATE family multidrug resistance protein
MQYLFVWYPPLSFGFVGSPIALSITYSLMSLTLVLYVKFVKGSEAWGGLDIKEMLNTRRIIEYVKLGIPGVVMVCSEWWAFEIIALAAGLLGDIALAAQSVVLNTCAFTYTIPLSLAIATTTRIGYSNLN